MLSLSSVFLISFLFIMEYIHFSFKVLNPMQSRSHWHSSFGDGNGNLLYYVIRWSLCNNMCNQVAAVERITINHWQYLLAFSLYLCPVDIKLQWWCLFWWPTRVLSLHVCWFIADWGYFCSRGMSEVSSLHTCWPLVVRTGSIGTTSSRRIPITCRRKYLLVNLARMAHKLVL